MKKLYTLLSIFLISSSIFAQTPQKMSYQAVIRDANGVLIITKLVGIQISILHGNPNGLPIYVETHLPTTNANGLVSFEIGNGTIVSGSMTSIDWANGPFFIKTESDLNGGTNYTITGTSPLLAVPYALHANVADSVVGGISEMDPVYTNSVAGGINSSDTSRWNQTIDTHLDSAGVAALGFNAGAHTVNTDDQTLSLTGTSLAITNGNNVNLSAIDTDTQLDSAGVAALGFVAGAHAVDTDTQLDSTGISSLGYVAGKHTINTDSQTLSLTGNMLTIANGNNVDLSSINTNTQLDSTGIASLGFVAGTHTVNTDDQTLSLSGTTLTIANGNNVDLSSINTNTQLNAAGIAALGFVAGSHTVDTDNQTLSLSGTTLTIADGNNVDLASIDTDTKLDSSGIAALGYAAGPHVIGSNKQISFNDNGAPGSDGELVYDQTTNQMAIGASTVHSSAALEVSSTSGGFMLPRMTTAQRDAIANPEVGLMIFNTDSGSFQGYAGYNNGVGLLIDHNTFLGNLSLSGQSFTAPVDAYFSQVMFNFFNAVNGGTISVYAGVTTTGTPIHTQAFSVAAGQQGIEFTAPIQLVAGQQYTIFTNETCAYYPFSTYAGGTSWTSNLAFPGDLWMRVITGNASWKDLHD